jgi:hypothetical protein
MKAQEEKIYLESNKSGCKCYAKNRHDLSALPQKGAALKAISNHLILALRRHGGSCRNCNQDEPSRFFLQVGMG